MTTIVVANDGTQIDLDSTAQVLGYTGSNLTSVTVAVQTYSKTVPPVVLSNTYTQTLTYTGANLTAISNWIKN